MPTQDVILLQNVILLGKKSIFHKLVKSDPIMKSYASAFILQNKYQEDISYLGENLMVDLFGGKSNDELSSLRNVIFTQKVAIKCSRCCHF